jgi:hypothetical protein
LCWAIWEMEWSIETSFGRCTTGHFHDRSNSQLSSKCRSSRRVCGWGDDLQPNPSNASRRRQSCALFGYDSCARYTALLKLMPDDARRPARLQGRDAAEDARTTHPCIRRWLGMLAEGPWEYSTMGKMGFNAYLDTTGQFCWWLAVRKHVGLMVVVADTYVVETDPSISSRSWIT